jgi:hypothetical protein
LTVLSLSATGIALSEVPELVEQLRKFSALKQLDVSNNPALRLLPVGLLRIAAGLEAFNCDGCSLKLPPQTLFLTSHENPGRVKLLLQGRAPATALNLSGWHLTPAVACEAAAVLVHYHELKQLDVSNNPALDRAAVATIVRAVSGIAASHILLIPYFIALVCFVCSNSSLCRSPRVSGAQPQRYQRGELA